MMTGERIRDRVALRVAGLAGGLALVVLAAHFLGFGRAEVAVITVIACILSALAIELPWKGFLFPADALLVCLCVLTASNRVVVLAVGMALVAGSLALNFGRTTLVAVLRNVLGSLLAVSIWRLLVPSLDVLLRGGDFFRLTGNTTILPAIYR